MGERRRLEPRRVMAQRLTRTAPADSRAWNTRRTPHRSTNIEHPGALPSAFGSAARGDTWPTSPPSSSRSLGRLSTRARRSRRPQWTPPPHLPYAPLLPHPIRCTTQLIRPLGAMRADLRKDAAPADADDQHFRRVRNSKAVGSCDVEVPDKVTSRSRAASLLCICETRGPGF